MDKIQHRLLAGVHGINRLASLIHREASFSCIPAAAAPGLNIVQVTACVSGIMHQST